MQNFRTFIFPGTPATTPHPDNNPNQTFPVLNGTPFIPPRQLALQLHLPQTQLVYRTISLSQQPPSRTFAHTGANTFPPPTAAAYFNQTDPQIKHSAGFNNPQGWPQQKPPPSYQGYPTYRWNKVNTNGQAPVNQVRTNTKLSPFLPQNTIYSITPNRTQNRTPAYTAIPTTPQPIMNQTDAYGPAQPEYGAVNLQRLKPEKIDTGKFTLNPNSVEFVPGKIWTQPGNKALEKKDTTKGPSKAVNTSKPLKNSKAEPNEASAAIESPATPPSKPNAEPHSSTDSTLKDPPEHHETSSSPLTEIHERNNPGPDSQPDRKEVNKTPENNTSPAPAGKLDNIAKTLPAAANNDASSGKVAVAGDTRQTETDSPIPSEPGVTKKTVDRSTDLKDKETEVSASPQKPVLPDTPVEPTIGHKFISDGSCRPKQKTRKRPVAQHSISVQEVLNLELAKKKPQKHPKELDLLYLQTFDFTKTPDLLVDINASGSQKKGKKRKELLQDIKTKLDAYGYDGRVPNFRDIKRMNSPEILLARPQSTIDIHNKALHLCSMASMINCKMYQERESLITSLAAYYVNPSVCAIGYAKTLIIKQALEKVAADQKLNIEHILMLFFPYFKPRQLELKADFLHPMPTLFCYPQLSNKELTKELYNSLEADCLNNLTLYNLHYTTTFSGIIALAKSLKVKIDKLQADGDQPSPPEYLSKQCIKTHLIFVCDLMHKMAIMTDKIDLTEAGDNMIGVLDTLLNIIAEIDQQLPEFQDEYIMTAQSCCFFLQKTMIQELISLQKKQLLKLNDLNTWEKEIAAALPAKLQNTLLIILENSLKQPGLLNISMCLLKTISDNKMFLPANSEEDQQHLVRLATLCKKIISKFGETLAQEGQESNMYPEKVLGVCMPVFKGISHIIRKGIPDSESFKQLNNAISKLAGQCETRLEKIHQEQRDYAEKLEKLENDYFNRMIKVIQEQANKTEQACKNKTKKETQLKKNRIIENQYPRENSSPALAHRQEFINQHRALIATTEKQLEKFKQNLRQTVDYEAALGKLDYEFEAIAEQPELQVWIYGDIAYDLCNACAKEFTRAGIFVQNINGMQTFCAEILKELGNTKGIRDRYWLYQRNPERPISKTSILRLAQISDPGKIQTLVKRALSSVSLYHKALIKAKTVADNPLPEMIQKTDKVTEKYLIFPEERQLLSERISFINEEIKSVKKHLKDLQNMPELSDVLSAISQIFKQLKPPFQKKPLFQKSTTLPRENANPGHKNNNDSDDEKFASLIEKSKSIWKLDTSITESQKLANEQLELIMKEFTGIQEQLTQERLNANSTTKAQDPPVTTQPFLDNKPKITLEAPASINTSGIN